MFEERKNNVVQNRANGAFTRLAQQLPLMRKGLLALAVAGVFSGCATIPHGSMFRDDRLSQQQSNLQPSLMIKKDIDLVRVEGVVGSSVEAAMIRLRATSMYGATMLIDDITVDERVGEAQWYSAVLDTAESMRDVEQFGIAAENGQLRLFGNMQSQAEVDALGNNAAAAVGAHLMVANDIDYPGREAEMLAQNSDEQTITAATLLPVEETETAAQAATQAQQQAVTEQQLTAQSIPSPAVSGTIALPVTTSAVVMEQPASLKSGEDIFVPQPDAGIVQPAGSGITANDSDGDGIVNSIDECNSRQGYPVNAKGCQALDGMLKNVRFQGDTNNLTREARASLDNVARVMNDYPAARIAILSYTSDMGTPLEARGQARKRARSVVGYLINKGVESTRLEAYAFGHINNSDDHIMIKEVD